jgi:hypothetical protein
VPGSLASLARRRRNCQISIFPRAKRVADSSSDDFTFTKLIFEEEALSFSRLLLKFRQRLRSGRFAMREAAPRSRPKVTAALPFLSFLYGAGRRSRRLLVIQNQ